MAINDRPEGGGVPGCVKTPWSKKAALTIAF
jgi:hypothetical protein